MEDPISKRLQPRNYIETLEERILQLEHALTQQKSTDETLVVSHAGNTPHGDDLRSEETTMANAFSSRVATLGLNAGGHEPRYLGSSSTFSFSRIISSSLLKAAPVQPKDKPLQQVEDVVQLPCLLPDYRSAVELSNAYFSHIQQQYPFLHEPTFRQWEQDLVNPARQVAEQDYVPLFFLYMVSAPEMTNRHN